jgi:hypothetical protein
MPFMPPKAKIRAKSAVSRCIYCLDCYQFYSGLFLSLPLGNTEVTGGMGRSEPVFLGSELSFFGFLSIFSLR